MRLLKRIMRNMTWEKAFRIALLLLLFTMWWMYMETAIVRLP